MIKDFSDKCRGDAFFLGWPIFINVKNSPTPVTFCEILLQLYCSLKNTSTEVALFSSLASYEKGEKNSLVHFFIKFKFWIC